MSEAKQTSMQDLIHWLKCGWMDEDIEAVIKKAEMLLEKEKEQIKDAYTDGCIGELYELNAYYTSEKYYNKTYDKGEPKR
jgi:hypothetical protein